MREHTIDTASGRKIDFDAPDPSQIALEDIAGALSRICRFGAQSSRFHSVAQHAVLVSHLLLEAGHCSLALYGLHHDSHEAFACDLPSPLKRKLRRAGEMLYEETCQLLDQAIFDALAIDAPGAEEKKIVTHFDRQALMLEAADLLHDGGEGIARSTGLQVERPGQIGPSLAPEDAHEAFLEAHRRLAG